MSETFPPVPSALLGAYSIAKTFDVTARQIQASATACGETNPVYFDDARAGGLVGHPGMVFTFQWNSRETPGVEIPLVTQRRSVHAYVDITWSRPFREGDAITCQARTVALRSVGPGALRVQRVTMRDARGDVVSELDYANIYRGVRVDGPDAWTDEPTAWPDSPGSSGEAAWEAEIPIPRTAAHVYTECGDLYNPIHTERRVALAAGLPDIILQGSATLLFALREFVDRKLDGDPGGVRRLAGRFRAMVIPGSPITLRCLEERCSDTGREFFFEVRNHEGGAAIDRGYLAVGGG